jgi:hypothetical protein
MEAEARIFRALNTTEGRHVFMEYIKKLNTTEGRLKLDNEVWKRLNTTEGRNEFTAWINKLNPAEEIHAKSIKDLNLAQRLVLDQAWTEGYASVSTAEDSEGQEFDEAPGEVPGEEDSKEGGSRHKQHHNANKAEKAPKAQDPYKEARKRCDRQCSKTGTACSGACFNNIVTLNLGGLVPCFASCGAASATCHKTVSQGLLLISSFALNIASRQVFGTDADACGKCLEEERKEHAAEQASLVAAGYVITQVGGHATTIALAAATQVA